MLDMYKRFFGSKNRPLQDVIRLRGCYEIALLDAETQEVIERRKIDNVVVTSGRRYVLSRILSSSPQTDVMNAIAVGTSTTAPATGDATLGSEGGGASMRIAIASFDTSNIGA